MWTEGNKAYAGRDSKHRVTPLTSSVALGAFGFLGIMTSCLLSYGCWKFIQLAVILAVRYSDWTQKANRKPTLSRWAGNKSQANALVYQTWWWHSEKYIIRWHQPEWWKGLSQFRGQSGKQRTSPGMHAQERGLEESRTLTHLSVLVLWTWPWEHTASSQVGRDVFPKVASTPVKWV